MSFSWLGRNRDSSEPEPDPPAESPTDRELASVREQLAELSRRIAHCEEADQRLDGIFELFNASLAELQQGLGQVRQELRDEREARKQLERQVESQRPVAEEEWELPSVPAAPAQAAEWSRSAERVLALLQELGREAPPAVRANLEATLSEALEIARALKGVLKRDLEFKLEMPSGGRKSPVIKKLREQVKEAIDSRVRSPQELEQMHGRLLRVLVPEFVEVLEAARRTGDPNLPYFRTLEERLKALFGAAELEEIRPAPGTMYRPAEQNLLKAIRSDEPNLRDQVERCVSRGFRYRGELVKKAEVTVYL